MKNTKTINDAELWVDTDNGSYKLADCDAFIEVFDRIQTLKLPNSETEYTVKSYAAALVICGNIKPEICESINIDLLKTVRRFNLKFEALEASINQCKVAVNEFENIIPTEIDLNGEWRFDITEHINTVKGLFPDLIFC